MELPFRFKIPGQQAGRCPLPLASRYRLESMVCSPVIHSNSARLVVTLLSLLRARRWRDPCQTRLLHLAACSLPTACAQPCWPPRRGPALCWQAAADVPPPNYRHSAAAWAQGLAGETQTELSCLRSLASTPTRPSVRQCTRPSTHPPATKPPLVAPWGRQVEYRPRYRVIRPNIVKRRYRYIVILHTHRKRYR